MCQGPVSPQTARGPTHRGIGSLAVTAAGRALPGRADMLEEPDDGLDPTMEVVQIQFFVRAVRIGIRDSPAGNHRREPQPFDEVGDNGDGSTGSGPVRRSFCFATRQMAGVMK